MCFFKTPIILEILLTNDYDCTYKNAITLNI